MNWGCITKIFTNSFVWLGLLLLVIPFFAGRYLLHVFIVSSIFAVASASWDVVSGYAGQVSFGHAAFFGIGGYIYAFISLIFGFSNWLFLIVSGIASAALSLLVGFPSLRIRGPALSLTTLAFASIVEALAYERSDVTRAETGLTGFKTILKSTEEYYFASLILLFGCCLVMYWLTEKSHTGLRLKAIREDEILAQSVGFNIANIKLFAFAISSFFAGVAGAFYANYLGVISVLALKTETSIRFIVIGTIGGRSTIIGPIIAAFILEYLHETFRALADYMLIIEAIATIFIILFAPKGLMALLERIIAKTKNFIKWLLKFLQ